MFLGLKKILKIKFCLATEVLWMFDFRKKPEAVNIVGIFNIFLD